jgi:hypothetical protein
MSIARKAQKNIKRYSSRSQSRSPLSTNISSSLPNELSASSSSSLVIKRQKSKDHNNRHSSPNTKHRPTSSDVSSHHHSQTRHHHRSPSNHDRHRSDVTLYLIYIRLTNLVIILFNNHIQYRTFKKDVG